MFDSICNIKGIHYTDPFFFSNQYLHNVYVKANALARHIHVFNHPVSSIDYLLFDNVNHAIQTLTEIRKTKEFDKVIRSNPIETVKSKYTFNTALELVHCLHEKEGSTEEQFFTESLKSPHSIRMLKSFNGTLLESHTILFNSVLEYEKWEKTTFNTNARTVWEPDKQQTIKYIFKGGEVKQKIIFRNDSYEQSKTILSFQNGDRIMDSKTYDQKNKTELLYEAIFEYQKQDYLSKIKYTRYKTIKMFGGPCTQEHTFEYNTSGLLVKFSTGLITKTWLYDPYNNPIHLSECRVDGDRLWETNYRYSYDAYDNWIDKEMVLFRFDQGKRVKVREVLLKRHIEYW